MRPPENSSELTAAQCAALLARVVPMLRFLRMLLNRIEQLRFPASDPLRRDVQAAYDSIHGLRVMLHYLECEKSKREREREQPRRRPWEGGGEKDTYWEYRQKR